ncbi:MAG: competence/damage-inducible protein A [Pseudomonadota bacterium]
MMRFGLIVVGDEILTGRRRDVHLSGVIDILAEARQPLSWARYVSDDLADLSQALRESFASGDTVFVTGGIGATPDDRTRQAAADALQRPLLPHPEGVAILEEVFEGDIYPNRVHMAHFPEGAELIPNPVNRVSGFSIENHYFVPGFPKMAHPMLRWVMGEYYTHLSPAMPTTEGFKVAGIVESQLTPVLEAIETDHSEITSYSLPNARDGDRFIEAGIKGMDPVAVQRALTDLRQRIDQHFGDAVHYPE